jgi:hypothetical protein
MAPLLLSKPEFPFFGAFAIARLARIHSVAQVLGASDNPLPGASATSPICQGLATVLKVEEGALPTGSTGSGIE